MFKVLDSYINIAPTVTSNLLPQMSSKCGCPCESCVAGRSPGPARGKHLQDPLAQHHNAAVNRPWRRRSLQETTVQQHGAGLVRSEYLQDARVQHLLATDKKAAKATHNMTAWRMRDDETGVVYRDCDDDGETAAGSRLLHLLELMDVWNVMVVVTRWYGGTHLGPDRFRIINSVARDAIVKAGLSNEAQKRGGHGGKKH